MPDMSKMELPTIDEKGAEKDGQPQVSQQRLFMQLQVFTGCRDVEAIQQALVAAKLQGVIYADMNDAQGVGVLLMSEDTNFFVTQAREFYLSEPFELLMNLPEMTMVGRTYALGREPNLEDWLLEKPRRTVLNPEWPWAIWYPLRRKAEFELLPKEDQGKILYEHAKIGMSYGAADFAHDVRLACYGLDKNDNEFVIGLVGKELHPLSHIIQQMRKTQQTAKYIESLGPFFVGKAVFQNS